MDDISSRVDALIDVARKSGVTIDDVDRNLKEFFGIKKPSSIMANLGKEVAISFSIRLQEMDNRKPKIKTMTTHDGETIEVIDGYDVVPISESEYATYGSGAWSIDYDKPNDLIEVR